MDKMAEFIASRIIKARQTSLEAGQTKYRAYFINTTLYADWKNDVDTILTTDGYGDCIVTD
jgi:hypothetical protein